MKQAARERTRAWFTVCVLCLYPVVTLRELCIRVTNLPFSWLPRIGLPVMDCKAAGQRRLEIGMLRMEFNDICISQLCFDLLVTPTVGKKLQTNVMLSYKLFLSVMCVFKFCLSPFKKNIYFIYFILFFYFFIVFSHYTFIQQRAI